MTTRVELFSTVRTEGLLLPSDTLAVVGGNDVFALPGLDPTDYHLGPGETFSSRITQSWNSLLGYWTAFRPAVAALREDDRTATTLTRERWLLPLFRELGYGWLQPTKALVVAESTYPVSHIWDGRLPVHLVGARVPLGERTPGVRGAAGISPHSMVQELLNRSGAHLWGVASNGMRLRLLRDNASLTRQAYVEWDLEALFDGQVYPDFVVLWKTLHQSRFEGDRPADWLIERWANESSARGVRALDDLRGGVQLALEALGRGFVTHPANGMLRSALDRNVLSAQDLYRQLLRLIYRLIFLAVSEDRDLLHSPAAIAEERARYERFYSFGRLRRLAERRTGTAHGDLWQALGVVRRALSGPGQAALGLAGLGSMLWSDEACPDLDRAALANRDLLDAVRALTLFEDRQARQLRLVDYRNLGPEELGSVYESLLELHPTVSVHVTDPRKAFALGNVAGNERKTTGSYYTPSSLIACLLDSTLDPVLGEAMAKTDPEAALLDLAVLDPACGSGHFLIAAAYRIARRLATVRTGEPEASPEAVRTALRDVIGRCLHGVDLNPMAAELCKVGLWLEALEPGKPLSFLEHRIVVGNALLGATPDLLDAGIPDEAFTVLTGDDKEVVAALKKRNKAERKGGQAQLFSGWNAGADTRLLAGEISEIDQLPDDTVEAVLAKEARWRSLDAGQRHLTRLRADAWCAAFVLPKQPGTIQITDGVWHNLVSDPTAASDPVLFAIEQARASFDFLHWHLEFPDVMARGGFDVIIGNPPWERVKLQEKEFFAARAPEIASAPNAAARKKAIAALEHDDPSLFDAYRQALRVAEGESHLLRSSGRFPLCGVGDVNTYAVFAEAFRDSLAPSGRAGVIVPLGIATDDTTKEFFGSLVERGELVSIYHFANEEHLFPAVDHRVTFCLLVMSGWSHRQNKAELAFYARQVADLNDPGRKFSLGGADFKLLNPNTRTCPVLRQARDAELVLAIYERVPVLLAEGPPEVNPWAVRLKQGLFHMSGDVGLFRTLTELENGGFEPNGTGWAKGAEHYLPMYEAKMVHQFNHRLGTYEGQSQAQGNQGTLPQLTEAALANPQQTTRPRYWVPEDAVSRRLTALGNPSWILVYRRTARSTDERTVIAAVLPRTAVNDKLPMILTSDTNRALLVGNLNAFVFDYITRLKLAGTDVNNFVVEQLPVLAPRTYDKVAPWEPNLSLSDWLKPYLLELVYTAWDLAPFAQEMGYDGPPLRWSDERRALLRAEVDAAYFHLYDFKREDVEYVMDSFWIVRQRDEKTHRHYRTKDLILEAYDRMAAAMARNPQDEQTLAIERL